tara:strand:+ start:3613 stop:4293 length:681 start_codon:yes stop_codon:yes gene_type:complete
MPDVSSALGTGGALAIFSFFSGAGGIFSTAFFSGAGGPSPLPTRSATRDDVLFEPWPSDEETVWQSGESLLPPQCTWWGGNETFSSQMCSHFSLSRLASTTSQRAIERAVRCAAYHSTDCVLSVEIGLSLPAAFLYDPAGEGMRMLIAPKLYENTSSSQDDLAMIRIHDVNDLSTGFLLKFNRSIRVEYLPGGSRAPLTETLVGKDAYCVQLLRAAYTSACWEMLD